MAKMIPDTLDFAAYMRQTDARVKVRPASLFADDVLRQFKPRDPAARKPEMFSTKLRNRIEFRPGEVTVWAGYNGHRKSMFAGQVALDLCVQRQRVLIASLEMQPAATLGRMAQQATGLPTPPGHAVEDFMSWTDDRLWIFDHLGRISPDECLAVIRYFAEELQGQHVFLDSMMMVCKSEEHLDEQKQFATDIVRIAQEHNIHIHLIAHCRKPQSGGDEKPPTKYDLRGSAAISDQAHNVALVWFNHAKKAAQEAGDMSKAEEPDALVTIAKQRNGSWEGKVKLWAHPCLRFLDEPRAHVEPYVMRTE